MLRRKRLSSGIDSQQQEVLRRLGSALSHGYSHERFLNELLAIAVQGTGAHRALLVRGTGDRHIARVCFADGRIARRTDDDISWAVVSRVLTSGEPCLYSDALTSEELASHRSIAVLKLRSLACVPVRAGSETVGALYLDHHGIAGLFGDEHLGFLDLVAGLLGVALHVAEVEQLASKLRNELGQTHQHVMRAERNRVAGEIASGIAHDLRNVLAAIVARSQLLRLGGANETTHKHVKQIESAAKSGAGLIERLQECAREHSAQEEESVNVLETAREALELLKPRLTRGREQHDASINASVSGNPQAHVMAVPGEIRELFLNLIVNACDAMPDGGELGVQISVDEESGEVQIVVRDSGIGMPEEARARAFEPFFTTKGKQGTGLGLVVVRNTVVHYGGSIRIGGGEENVGTTFTIRLPLWIGDKRHRRRPAVKDRQRG
ncbi:MAG: sensor histidine kinase [Planctomycetota bacterium]